MKESDRLLDNLDSVRLSIDACAYYVYMLCDAQGDPFYIGRSASIFGRLGYHMGVREKRAAIKSVNLIRCSSETEMNDLELALIKLYKPELNKQGLEKPRPSQPEFYEAPPSRHKRRERFIQQERARRGRRQDWHGDGHDSSADAIQVTQDDA